MKIRKCKRCIEDLIPPNWDFLLDEISIEKGIISSLYSPRRLHALSKDCQELENSCYTWGAKGNLISLVTGAWKLNRAQRKYVGIMDGTQRGHTSLLIHGHLVDTQQMLVSWEPLPPCLSALEVSPSWKQWGVLTKGTYYWGPSLSRYCFIQSSQHFYILYWGNFWNIQNIYNWGKFYRESKR